MTDSLANLEPLARAVCARQMSVRNPAEEIPELVERYWRVTAALLEAGLIDPDDNAARPLGSIG